MGKILRGILFCMVLCLSCTLIACEKPGPAEQAGKNLDQAFDSVKKKADDLTK